MTTEQQNLIELAERVAALTGHDPDLDADVAEALGWHTKRVTGLGLNGRTPGSYLWFPPNAEWGYSGKRKPPRFTGPKMRPWTVTALRARASQSRSEK